MYVYITFSFHILTIAKFPPEKLRILLSNLSFVISYFLFY